MNEPDWVGRWWSSAVTRGVWHGLCVCVCVSTLTLLPMWVQSLIG